MNRLRQRLWPKMPKCSRIHIFIPVLSLVGVAVSVFLYILFRKNEKQSAINQLENSCDIKQMEVQRQLTGGITLMYALMAILEAGGKGNMNDDIWDAQTKRLVTAGNWTILSISRSVLVPAANLSDWESSSGLEVVQTAADLSLIPVPRNRSLYLPIINTYPKDARIRGLDNLSEPARREVALRAFNTSRLVLSDPFPAPNVNPAGGGSQRAFLLFLPLRDAKGDPVGAVTEAFFENTIVSDRFSGGITYSFGIGDSILFSDEHAQSSTTIVRQRDFPIADRYLALRCALDFRQSPAPVIVAVLGVTLSVLAALAVSALTWIRHKRRAAVTEAQRLEDERRVADNLYKVKNTFLNHVSHELKTPLNGVQGVLSNLMDEGLTTEQLQAINEASVRADELADMLDNLIDYSAFEAGNVSIWLENTPLSRIVADAVQWVHKLLKRGRDGNRNVFRGPDVVPPVLVFTDLRKLGKVVRILLHNGLKYTRHGVVRLDCSTEGQWGKIAVTDTGIGIAPSVLACIRRGDMAQGRKVEGEVQNADGLGLGLSLVQRILSTINATLEIDSTEGMGSTFAIKVPLATPDTVAFPIPARDDTTETMELQEIAIQPRPVSPAQHSPGSAKKVVLVADDNDLNRKVLCRMLQKLGYECVEANDGLQALKAYEEHGDEVSLVLMDIQMPRMDGLQATKELKLKNKSIPVVAVTANAVSAELLNYMESGMSEVLNKPVNKDQLERVLRTYVQRRPGVNYV